MAANGLTQRHPPASDAAGQVRPQRHRLEHRWSHPGGAIKHGSLDQLLRMALFVVFFLGSCACIFTTQLLGAPLYFYDKGRYYAWMAVTKRHFGLIAVTMTQWWAPSVVRVSGDATVRGQLCQKADGQLECRFPPRMVLIANHQIYTDWIYLWWIAYTAGTHGHLYIILKESIKLLPVLGQGMMFYSFIFLSRRWAKDKDRFQHRLRKLNFDHRANESQRQSHQVQRSPPSDAVQQPARLPMWLLIYPEGTNLSSNGRESSQKWAERTIQADMQHLMLPRSKGLQFCLQEMRKTVDWLYDCTVAYEGVPRGQFAQDLFTLRSTFFEGRRPRSVNMHWRRFALAAIPLDDDKTFEAWLLERWREKDALLEHYVEHGRFPADDEAVQNAHDGQKTGNTYVETEVRPTHPFEFVQALVPAALVVMVISAISRAWRAFVVLMFGSA